MSLSGSLTAFWWGGKLEINFVQLTLALTHLFAAVRCRLKQPFENNNHKYLFYQVIILNDK